MKKICLYGVCLLMPMMAVADEVQAQNQESLTLAVRRIGLEWSQTNVDNADKYRGHLWLRK